MNTRTYKIDVHMPVRHGDFIVGDVLERFVQQAAGAPHDKVEIKFYVDASEDLDIDGLGMFGNSSLHTEQILYRAKCAYKRNIMIHHFQTHRYVYFADSDVLLPTLEQSYNQSIFAAMVRGLERHPRMGAIGLCYQRGNHVATGSMMLRWSDLKQIGPIVPGKVKEGPIRGIAESCMCNYIARKLLEQGKLVVPLRSVRAEHLDLSREKYDDYRTLTDESVFSHNALKLDRITQEIEVDTPHFKVDNLPSTSPASASSTRV